MRQRIKGFTLVELLVSLALFGIMGGITVQFFLTQSRASQLQKAVNEAGESARIALSLIGWDIQNAGYLVNTSNVNPAIEANSNNTLDSLTVRYFDLDLNSEQKVLYNVGGSPSSLRRAQYDASASAPTEQPSVGSIVALNILYETRANQFVSPSGSGSSKTCPAGASAIPTGATGSSIDNCQVAWQWSNTPTRLVRQVKIQVLARSSYSIPGYSGTRQSYSFATPNSSAGLSYSTKSGYVYQFAEQTVIAANLGR